MVKTANVVLVGKEYIGAGYVTVMVRGAARWRVRLSARDSPPAHRGRQDSSQGRPRPRDHVSAHRDQSQAAQPVATSPRWRRRALAPRTKQAEAELAEFSHEHLDDPRGLGSDVAVKGSILEPHSRTEPASVRVVPLDSGCAPTGPTLAALLERRCRARHSHVHRPSTFSKSRSRRFPRANRADATVSRGRARRAIVAHGDFLTW